MTCINFVVASKDFNESLKTTILSIDNYSAQYSINCSLHLVFSSEASVVIAKNFLNHHTKLCNFSLLCDSRGIYSAYNVGLSACDDGYVCFLGAGETLNFSPKHTEFWKSITYSRPDLLLFPLTYNNGSFSFWLNYPFATVPRHQCCLYSLRLISQINLVYDCDLSIHADFIFTSAFLEQTTSLSLAPFPLIDFKTGGLGTSRKGSFLRIRDRFIIFVKYKTSFRGFCSFCYSVIRELCFNLVCLIRLR